MRILNCLQQIPNLTGAPAVSNTAGSLYLENSDSRLYASDGTTWRKVAYLDDVPGQGSSTIDVDFPVGTEYTWTISDSNATIGKSVVARHANGGTTKLGIKQPYRQFENATVESAVVNDVVWTGSMYIAVGLAGNIASSPDGINWVFHDSFYQKNALDKDIIGITFDGVAIYMITKEKLYKSSDFCMTFSKGNTFSIGDLRAIYSIGPEKTVYGTTGGMLDGTDGYNWNSASLGDYSTTWGGTVINKFTYGASGGYLFIGDGGHIATKEQGSTTFVDRTSNLQGTTWGTTNVTSVVYTGQNYIIGGDGGKISYSPDGVTWTASTLPSHPSWASLNVGCMAFGNGVVFAVASASTDALYAYSTDHGVTWSYGTSFTGTFTPQIKTCTFGGDIFLVTDSDGNTAITTVDSPTTFLSFVPNLRNSGWGSASILTIAEDKTTGRLCIGGTYGTCAYSTDGGVNWTKTTSISSQLSDSNSDITKIVHNGQCFLAIISSSTAIYKAFTSTDAITWIEKPALSSLIMTGTISEMLAFDDGRFVGFSYASTDCIYSTDNADTWNVSTSFQGTDVSTMGGVVSSVTVSNGAIYCFGYLGMPILYVSYDYGETWSLLSYISNLGSMIKHVASHKNKTVISYNSTTKYVLVSYDGLNNWIRFGTPFSSADVQYIGVDDTGKFYFLTSECVYSSDDFINWVAESIDVTHNSPKCFIFSSSGKFIVCDNAKILKNSILTNYLWMDKYVEFSAADDTDVDPIMIRGFVPETGKITFKAKSKTITSGTKKVTYTIK